MTRLDWCERRPGRRQNAGIAVLAAIGHQISESQLAEALKAGDVVFVGADAVNSVRRALNAQGYRSQPASGNGPQGVGVASGLEASNLNASGFVIHRSRADHMQAWLRG